MNEQNGHGEQRFGLLPTVSGAAAERILGEMLKFARLNPEARRESIEQDMAWLQEHNPELASAIRGLPDGMIGVPSVVADKLTHTEWYDLRMNMVYAHLLVLRVLNEGERERKEA
jgi:hypothetical protein